MNQTKHDVLVERRTGSPTTQAPSMSRLSKRGIGWPCRGMKVAPTLVLLMLPSLALAEGITVLGWSLSLIHI